MGDLAMRLRNALLVEAMVMEREAVAEVETSVEVSSLVPYLFQTPVITVVSLVILRTIVIFKRMPALTAVEVAT